MVECVLCSTGSLDALSVAMTYAFVIRCEGEVVVVLVALPLIK